MPDREAVADFDFGAVFGARAEEGADYALLVCVAAEGVVEDGEDCLEAGGGGGQLGCWEGGEGGWVWGWAHLGLYYHV